MTCHAKHRFSYHDYIDSPADHEYSLDLDGGQVIHVSKVGGGTPGEAYDGDWYYSVTNGNGRELLHGDNLRSGLPQTHRQMAETLAAILSAGEVNA